MALPNLQACVRFANVDIHARTLRCIKLITFPPVHAYQNRIKESRLAVEFPFDTLTMFSTYGKIAELTHASLHTTRFTFQNIPCLFTWNLLFRNQLDGIVTLLMQIARPKERLPRKSQRLRTGSRTIHCRACFAAPRFRSSNDAQGSFPARKIRERDGWFFQREVDEEWLADDGCARHQSPVAAVVAVVTVVAEHKVAVGRDGQFAISDQRVHLHPPARIDRGVGAIHAREVVAVAVRADGR